MSNNICQNCGSKIGQCVSACRQAAEDENREKELSLFEQLSEQHSEVDPWLVQLTFDGDHDTQRILVNRLRAQWRWAIEVIDPDPSFDQPEWNYVSGYLVNLARREEHLGGSLTAVYDVSMDGIERSQAHDEWTRFFEVEFDWEKWHRDGKL